LGIARLNGVSLRSLGGAAASEDWKEFSIRYLALKLAIAVFGIGVLAVFLAVLLVIGADVHRGSSAVDQIDMYWITASAAFYLVIQLEMMPEHWALSALRRRFVSNLLLLTSILVFVIVVVPAVLYGAGPSVVFLSLAGGTLVARFGAFVYWRRQRFLSPWRDSGAAILARLHTYFDRTSAQYIFYGILLAALQADIFIVGAIGGPAAAAEYTLVWKVAEILVLVIWRLAENVQPDLVHAEFTGDRARLLRIYSYGLGWLAAASLGLGAVYAVFGRWLVGLWVGPANVPDAPWAFALAGGAVLCLGATRLSASFAFALGRVSGLARLATLELAVKWLAAAALYPVLDYLAVLVAINATFVLGLAWAYLRLGRRVLAAPASVAESVIRP
jgi:O-antigen/teichoic acid export membrane protein